MACDANNPKTKRRWPRISLRVLLLLILVISVPLAIKVNRTYHWLSVESDVQKLGGYVTTAIQIVDHKPHPPGLFYENFFRSCQTT